MPIGPNARRAAARFLRTAWRIRAQAASRRARRGSASNREGFTLVELMVVIVIIGLLATVVVINVLPSQDRAMVGKARADISVLEQAVETYRLDNLTFPDDRQGLQALVAAPAGLIRPERYRQGGYVRRLPEDPWGNPYQYRRPSAHGGQFDVFSYGADGREGGEGNDADLGNWES
jgi:general secretion pathway protein G